MLRRFIGPLVWATGVLAVTLASCGRDQRSRLDTTSDDTTSVTSTDSGAGDEADEDFTDKPTVAEPQTVMSWVPPYAIGGAQRLMAADYDGVRPVDSLTRLGLQFWTIRSDGSVQWLGTVDEEDTSNLTQQAQKEGIEVLLTVINDGSEYGQEGFHWQVVRDALSDGGAEKVASELLRIVDEFQLDGIDLDLEAGGGAGPYTEDDRAQFLELIEALGPALHAQGRLLTVDSFIADNGLAPSPSWWSDWPSHVDAVHAMGYVYSFKNGAGTSGYQYLLDRGAESGFRPNQILPALPVWVDAWAGDESNYGISHVENLRHIAHCLSEPTGVALWAFHHPETHTIPESGEKPWATGSPWEIVTDIKNGHEREPEWCTSTEEEEAVVDNMQTVGINRLGGKWLAVTDYWDRPEDDRGNRTSVLNLEGDYDLALGEGTWGQISRGYHVSNDVRMLSAHVIRGTGPGAYGGLWMEFLPRDCDQLDTPSDGCGWRQEALVGLDLRDKDAVVVGARCEAGQRLTASLQSRTLALTWEPPFSLDVECSGEFEDYTFSLSEAANVIDVSEVTTLRLELWAEESPAELELDVIGVALDRSVLEIQGLD